MVGRFAFCLALGLLATASAVAGEARCVLLRNGNVLRGEVRLVGGQYCISSQGSELRFAEAVDLVGASLDDLYRQLRGRQTEPTLVDRMRLADWCQRQAMWSLAARELLHAQRETPGDPRVAAAQRRLWHARELALQAEQPPAEDSNHLERDPQVTPATHTAPGEMAPTAGPLSANALQRFTRQVQPILVNNCTTSGCHAVGGPQSFQLNRDLLHGQASRRSIDANLAAVLRALDAANPQASPLLAAMAPSHAAGRGPRLRARRAELRQAVAEWVNDVTGGDQEQPATAEPQVVPTIEDPPALEMHQPGYFEALRDARQWEQETDTTPPAPKRGGLLQPAGPRDEFDPALFNDRFGPQATAGE